MVAPYALLLLSLGVGIAVLQLPFLPSSGFAQLLVLITGLGWLISYLSLRLKTGEHSLRPSRRFTLTAASAFIMSLSTLLVVLPANRWLEQQLPLLCERQLLRVEGVVEGLIHRVGSDDNRRYRFSVRVLDLSPKICAGPEHIRVYLDPVKEPRLSSELIDAAVPSSPRNGVGTNLGSVRPGSRVLLDARLRRPWGLVNPGAADGEKSFLVANIHAIGSAENLQTETRSKFREIGISAMRDRLRDAISQDIQHRVPGEVGALLSALAVGDRRGMNSDVWERLRLYGVSHLLVISGMHISLLAVPGWYLGAGLSRVITLFFPLRVAKSVLPPVFSLLTASGYGLLSGFALPSQRAVLMLALVLLPGIWGRTVHAGRMLPLVGLALFLLNPMSILSASFWLTFGAVALLLWYAAWRGSGKFLGDTGRAQGFMLLAMLPLSLFWFGEASGIGGLINLVAIPLITLVVVPLVLGFMLCAPIIEGLGELQLKVAASVLSTLWSTMAYWESSLSQWSVLQGDPHSLTLLLAIMGVLLLPLPASAPKLIIIACLFFPLAISERAVDAETVDLVFFDVGQGTAVFLRHGDQALLYDTGGGAPGGPAIAARSLLPMFRSQGIESLDTLIISHPDRDHDAGEGLVMEMLQPNRIRRGFAADKSQACRLGEVQRISDKILIRYLSQRLVGDSDNNASCAVLLSVYGRNILLAGDIDSRRERALLAYWGRELQVDILLAGHHGSASSNSRLWLRSLAPEIMVVTAGRSNRFGHPAARVLETAKEQGVSVINTANHGAVIFRFSPDGSFRCEASRNRGQPFWRRGTFASDCIPPPSAIRGYNQRDR